MCARRFLAIIFWLVLLAVGAAFLIFQYGQQVLIKQAIPQGHYQAPPPQSGPDYKADASHPLVFEVFDANGKMTKVTSNPLDIALKEHETVVILYNSPNVTPQPFANWSQFVL